MLVFAAECAVPRPEGLSVCGLFFDGWYERRAVLAQTSYLARRSVGGRGPGSWRQRLHKSSCAFMQQKLPCSSGA